MYPSCCRCMRHLIRTVLARRWTINVVSYQCLGRLCWNGAVRRRASGAARARGADGAPAGSSGIATASLQRRLVAFLPIHHYYAVFAVGTLPHFVISFDYLAFAGSLMVDGVRPGAHRRRTGGVVLRLVATASRDGARLRCGFT